MSRMRADEVEFARRSVKYLRGRGLQPTEIRSALVAELECPPEIAQRLATAA